METREEKVARLEALKTSLLSVEGTPTEVYSRIVGYYRSVRNWNPGKREEFGRRLEYSFPSDSIALRGAPAAIASYMLFSRATCPNCPPVKGFLSGCGLPGVIVDVDTDEGLDMAKRYEILSTPTAVLLNASGDESSRAHSRAQLEALLESAGELRMEQAASA